MNPETQEVFEKTIISRPTKRPEQSKEPIKEISELATTHVRLSSEPRISISESKEQDEKKSIERKESLPMIDQNKLELLGNKLQALDIPISDARFYSLEPPFDKKKLSLIKTVHEMDDVIEEMKSKRLPMDMGDEEAWRRARIALLDKLTEDIESVDQKTISKTAPGKYLRSLSPENFLALAHDPVMTEKIGSKIKTFLTVELQRRDKAGEFQGMETNPKVIKRILKDLSNFEIIDTTIAGLHDNQLDAVEITLTALSPDELNEYGLGPAQADLLLQLLQEEREKRAQPEHSPNRENVDPLLLENEPVVGFSPLTEEQRTRLRKKSVKS